MDEIESKVIKIIGEQLGKDEADIKLESNFVDDLEADSLDTVELVMALEDRYCSIGCGLHQRSSGCLKDMINFSKLG